MDRHSLEVLELEKVRRMLYRWTFSVLGRELAERLAPDLDAEGVVLSQARITEWKRLELGGEAPGSAEVADLRPLLLRLERGRETLDARDLFAFVAFLEHLASLHRLRRSIEEHPELAPHLAEILGRIEDFSGLRARLARSVSAEGEVLDTASAALGRIRQELLLSLQRASELLEEIRGRIEHNREDAYVTLREGRYVLSVRTQSRGELPGLLHGRSHSGQSVLLEPLEAVETNNRVAEGREEERQEVARILHELTAQLREQAASLNAAFAAAGELELIRAEAKLALDLRCAPVELNREGHLRLVQARHPVLAEAEARGGNPVVPLNLELFPERPVLVVSGPNMGGKTVALKTVGLLILMARAGLHVPAAEGTTIPLTDDVFVDLGDEQSIEGDLSTFAGHLRNVGTLWTKATPRSLVLLDELGGGTDPEEGAALAKAILEGMAERGTMTLATTHLTSVKLFVSEQPRMQNAAMEFDAVALTPRFRLKIGEPGGSRAFDIARRILPDSDLLKRAEGHRSPLLVQLDRILAESDAQKRRLEEERRGVEAEKEELRIAAALRRKQAERLKERVERLRLEREEALGRLYREAEESIRVLREELEEKARERPAQAVAEIRRAEREVRERGDRVRARRRRVPRGRKLSPGEITAGREAFLANLAAVVRIQRVEAQRTWVEWQGRRLLVPTADLEEVPEARRTEPPRRQLLAVPEQAEGAIAERELDLRGCRAEEALEKLDRFLDRASLAKLHQVRIVHGKGTGVLKRVIENHLRTHPLVGSFRMGELGEGGWGVTVADLGPSSS